jgi:hypothetical protein
LSLVVEPTIPEHSQYDFITKPYEKTEKITRLNDELIQKTRTYKVKNVINRPSGHQRLGENVELNSQVQGQLIYNFIFLCHAG